jgi:penicillin-binding protein 1A
MMTRFFTLIRSLIIFFLLFTTLLVVATIYYMENYLPDIAILNTVQLQTPLQIFTQDKKLIATFGEKFQNY